MILILNIKYFQLFRKKKIKYSLTSSVTLTEVREPPDITKSHTEANAGEQILGFVVPLGSVSGFLLFHPLQVLVRRNTIIQPRIWYFQSHGCFFFFKFYHKTGEKKWIFLFLLNALQLRSCCLLRAPHLHWLSWQVTPRYVQWPLSPTAQLSAARYSLCCIM